MPGSRKNSSKKVSNKKPTGGKGSRSRSRSSSDVKQSVQGLAHAINQGNFGEEENAIKEEDKLKKRGNTAGIAALIKKFDKKASPERRASPKKASPGRRASPKKASPGRGTTAKRSSPRRASSNRSPREIVDNIDQRPQTVRELVSIWNKRYGVNLTNKKISLYPQIRTEVEWLENKYNNDKKYYNLWMRNFVLEVGKDNVARHKMKDVDRITGERYLKEIVNDGIHVIDGHPTLETVIAVEKSRQAKLLKAINRKKSQSEVPNVDATVGFDNQETFTSRNSQVDRDIGIGLGPVFGPAARSNSRSSSSRSSQSVVGELPNFKRDGQSPKKTGIRGVRQTARRALGMPKGSFTQNSAIRWLTGSVARGFSKIAGVDNKNSRNGGGYKRNSKNKQRKNGKNKQRKN